MTMKRFSKSNPNPYGIESISNSHLTQYERVEARNAAEDAGLSLPRWVDEVIREALAARGKVDRGQPPEYRARSAREMSRRFFEQGKGVSRRMDGA
jgi:hypothetical protein